MTATITKILKLYVAWFDLCVIKNNTILSISDIFTLMQFVPLED